MRSGLLPLKIAFLVLALFTVTWQCAAQCIAEPCHEAATKVPPCHRQPPTGHQTPAHLCNVSVLTAEAVQTDGSARPEMSGGMLFAYTLPDLLDSHLGLTAFSRGVVRLPVKPRPPSDLTLALPLRI